MTPLPDKTHTKSQTNQGIFDLLTGELVKVPEIAFAYVYGSVLDLESVHDVDVGLYLDDSQLPQWSDIPDRLIATVELPVDGCILNSAFVSLLFHVFRGCLLFSRNEALLTNLLKNVPRQYLDIATILRRPRRKPFPYDSQSRLGQVPLCRN